MRKRKSDHIRISLDRNVQARNATTGLEDVHFVHKALPEVDKSKINMSTTVFNHKFSAPLIVGAITGGAPEATEINATIAEAVEKLGLGNVAQGLDKPVIAKETGAGIAAEEAAKLENAGVKGIDISGVGGTSWAAVEYYRTDKKEDQLRQRLGDVFWDWGIATASSIVEVSQYVNIPVIASGGIRNGIDIAKALALGASLTSLSQPVLQTATKGMKETTDALSLLIEELRNVMFLVGAESIQDLRRTPLVVTGKTAEWLRIRGFNTESYARRGRK
jgi:isopentenyl diphosphate isomerase/L-lactate dehydrogenase-like FMN-dependent dehydrogenase